jgi:hypothetical protein
MSEALPLVGHEYLDGNAVMM